MDEMQEIIDLVEAEELALLKSGKMDLFVDAPTEGYTQHNLGDERNLTAASQVANGSVTVGISDDEAVVVDLEMGRPEHLRRNWREYPHKEWADGDVTIAISARWCERHDYPGMAGQWREGARFPLDHVKFR
jgi:hypothetical protein